MKVCKFGGTSVADSNQIKKVAKIIKSDKNRKYVVVSAPGKRDSSDNKITDLLYLTKSNFDHNAPFEEIFDVIKKRFFEIQDELKIDADISKALSEIKNKIKAGASEDYIVSRGEYLNAKIIAKYLGFEFVDAKDYIVFDESGKFLQDKTNKKLKELKRKKKGIVMPGFYGSLPNKKIKTFSRGGSDITGSLLSKAINVSVYENWTDVSGFMMADPRIIKNPKKIHQITFNELRELSYMGATVLHENAIYPVRTANIPINIRNTNDVKDKGTLIVNKKTIKTNSPITGIAGKKNFVVITLYKNLLTTEKGFIRKALTILEEENIAVEHIPSGIDTVSLIIDSKYANNTFKGTIKKIEAELEPDSIDVFHGISLIATVGEGMANKTGTASKLFGALSKADVNIKMIDQGSSEMNIIVGVKDEDFENAIKAIYKAFV